MICGTSINGTNIRIVLHHNSHAYGVSRYNIYTRYNKSWVNIQALLVGRVFHVLFQTGLNIPRMRHNNTYQTYGLCGSYRNTAYSTV